MAQAAGRSGRFRSTEGAWGAGEPARGRSCTCATSCYGERGKNPEKREMIPRQPPRAELGLQIVHLHKLRSLSCAACFHSVQPGDKQRSLGVTRCWVELGWGGGCHGPLTSTAQEAPHRAPGNHDIPTRCPCGVTCLSASSLLLPALQDMVRMPPSP